MKINSPLKKSGLQAVKAVSAKPVNRSAPPKASWFVAGGSALAQAEKESSALNRQGRAPEFWLRPGEQRIIRIRHKKALGGLYRYTIPVRGKFRSYTAPPEGEIDLFRSQLGKGPTLRAVYELIDRTGFKDRDGKHRKDFPCFWLATGPVRATLEAIEETVGDLSKQDLVVRRTGSGRNTTYTVLPKPPSPMPDSLRRMPMLSADLEQYFSPPDEATQRAILANIGLDEDEAPAEDLP